MVLNLGTGAGLSVKEIVNAGELVTQRSLPHTTGERRVGDLPVLVADGPQTKNAALGARRSSASTLNDDAWRWHTSERRAAILST